MYVVVLIVAKCIVNLYIAFAKEFDPFVLIVAKCIVNSLHASLSFAVASGINSSKVYCKYHFLLKEK